MVNTPTSVGASAQIICLPTATTYPVVQQRRVGRPPKTVASLLRYREKIEYAAHLAETRAEEMEALQIHIATARVYLDSLQYQLAKLKQVCNI